MTSTSGAGAPISLYGGSPDKRVTIVDVQRAKDRGEKWAMLTAYDATTARILDDAGIPVLLVGDSAAMLVYGHESTLPVTVDEMIPLVRAVTRGSRRALVVADLPFGSYQSSVAQAVDTAARFMKDGHAHAVKLEGGERVLPQVEAIAASGVPVMAHLGLTPQSVHAFGGFRVQGRGESGEQLLQDAKALQEAGAFAVVLEAVPADLARRVTDSLVVPTIGIGAGAGCDAQVLVWQDMAGMTTGHTAKFVKAYADLRGALTDAAQSFAVEVRDGVYPGPAHTYV
ncbi:MAG TPA: 3-methyl-2-oxobutanoate hydroxymethyltransferase [Mycobacteriales bacterium]|jgi:3-methyl-2-oxobutanoate hydroxymethyltransferase|nr:3-methyl-2-oxobutanoate hydroxymethyltransferase [Mycobacteriales bacterium]